MKNNRFKRGEKHLIQYTEDTLRTATITAITKKGLVQFEIDMIGGNFKKTPTQFAKYLVNES